jgi:hypothetical protein
MLSTPNKLGLPNTSRLWVCGGCGGAIAVADGWVSVFVVGVGLTFGCGCVTLYLSDEQQPRKKF